jgi:hypothetical protein
MQAVTANTAQKTLEALKRRRNMGLFISRSSRAGAGRTLPSNLNFYFTAPRRQRTAGEL